MMKKTVLFTVLACIFGCHSGKDAEMGALDDALPIVLELQDKIATDNAFAFDLFKATDKFADAGKNIFISPLSVSMALNMTLNGANGTTADEMLEALRAKGYTMDEINEYSKSLRDALLEVDPSTKIAIANSIWYRQSFPVKDAFINVNRDNYYAEIKAVDFNLPDAKKQINDWIAGQTNDKIKDVIDGIDPATMMFLINAIYFKGIWASKFDKADTKEDVFYLSGNKTSKVQMMNQTNDFKYASDESASYLELPYGNGAFSMVIALPHEGKAVGEVLENLDSENWNGIINNMYTVKVNVRLPRFKIECKYGMEKSILPDMGMKVPFLDGMADFGGISDISLFISQVIHRTFVEVDEVGTEAAAVTVVVMQLSASVPSNPVDFIVNKPFLFAIREKSTGVILFIGRVEAV